MFSAIDNYIDKCIQISDEERAFFHSKLNFQTIKKKEYLLKQGEVCTVEAFVLKGCLRTFFIDDKGDEFILTFAVENWWVGDLASFNNMLPSNMYIQALEDSELLLIHHSDKEEIYKKVPQFERMFRIMIQRALAVMQQRFFSYISKPAKQRYLDFLHQYPLIPQRVSQQYIASYLGISPEFLSKIKAKKVKSR